jgi:hypothetical protein
VLDVFEVADLLVAHAIASHPREVDIIAYSGSYAQGTATPASDLDIFYIPADGKNPPIGRTVLIDGILFDFWAIDWQKMEGFATGRIRGWAFAPSLVHHAKVLHARSEEQAERFAELKQRVIDLQQPKARHEMIRRSLDMYRNVMIHLGNLRLAIAGSNLTDVRHSGWKIIQSTWECLALSNQTLFDRGWGSIPGEISKLSSRPADLEELIMGIATSEDASVIGDTAERLALETREVLRQLQDSISSTEEAEGTLDAVYPEIKDMVGKVLSACGRREPFAAGAAAWFLQSDLSAILAQNQQSDVHGDFNLYSEFATAYRKLALPDLMDLPPGGLSELAEEARLLDTRLRRWMCEQSVGLHEFETLEEFKRSL